jgi:hypothetical protein
VGHLHLHGATPHALVNRRIPHPFFQKVERKLW